MNALALLFLLAFLVSVDLRIIAPVLPSITESLRASAGSIGLAMTSYAFAYGAGQLVYGPLSDRHGRVAVVRAAAVGFSVCTALSALSATTWQFVAARLLAGAFAGAVIPLTLVHIGDTVEYARRQVMVARFSIVTSAGLAFSAAIGGLVAHFVSWRAMLVGYALIALVPSALLWRLPPGTPVRPPGDVRPVARFADFLMDPFGRLVYVSIFAEGFLLWGAVAYLGAYAAAEYGMSQLEVGLLFALFGVGTMVGGALMGPLRRRLSERGLARGGGLVMGLSLLMLVPTGPWPIFGAAMLLLGLGFVGLHTTLQVYGTEISQAARGKAFSLFPASLFLGMALGTAVMGPLVDAGGERVVLAVSGVGLAAVGAVTARIRRRRSA
ncbi:MAG TPA: MFS transporter [Methylomirabilota bacterium]|jgi:predicted MFS family arabinose efflux permease